MPKEDHLFNLIASLDKAERRYFKISSSRSSNKNESTYIEMYDVLSKQKIYDETALINKLSTPSFIKNLAQNKKYLKGLILKSLREKYKKSPTDIVNELLKDQDVLGKKMLFLDRQKKLQKAKEIAVKYELFDLNISILDIEMKLLLIVDFNKSQLLFDEYIQSKELLTLKFSLLSRLNISLIKVYSLMLKYNKKIDSEQLSFIQKEFELYNEKEILDLDSFNIKYIYFQFLDSYYALKNDFENNVKACWSIYNLFDKEYEKFKQVKNNEYVMSYYNYVSSLFRAGKFELLYDLLNKANTITIKSENTKFTFFIKTTSNWLSYYLNTGKIEEAFLLENKFEEFYKKQREKIDNVDLISIFYNFSLIYFFNEKFEKCLTWLNRLEDLKEKQRTDIHTDAYVISIICHFERNNYSVLESLVRSKRSRTGIIEIENLIIRSILKSSKNELKKMKVFENLSENLKELTDSFVTVDWTTLDLWLDSKTKNQSLQELYRKEVL